jgi:hypothetical protein
MERMQNRYQERSQKNKKKSLPDCGSKKDYKNLFDRLSGGKNFLCQ